MDPLFDAKLCIVHLNECLRLMQEAAEKGDTELLSIYEQIAEKYMEAAGNIMEGGNKERDTGESEPE